MPRRFLPLFFLLFAGPASGQVDFDALQIASSRGPSLAEATAASSASDQKMTSELKMVLYAAVRVYQFGISKHASGACSFEPSCSAYAVQSLQKKPAHIALLAIADRLTRCNGRPDMADHYTFDLKTGRFLDPVDCCEDHQ